MDFLLEKSESRFPYTYRHLNLNQPQESHHLLSVTCTQCICSIQPVNPGASHSRLHHVIDIASMTILAPGSQQVLAYNGPSIFFLVPEQELNKPELYSFLTLPLIECILRTSLRHLAGNVCRLGGRVVRHLQLLINHVVTKHVFHAVLVILNARRPTHFFKILVDHDERTTSASK